MTIICFSALKRNVPVIAASALVMISTASQALAYYPPTVVGSGAADLSISLEVADLAVVGLATPIVAGTAPANYNPAPYQAASLTSALNLGEATLGLVNLGVGTGILSANANGSLPTSTATATVNGLALGLNLTLIGTLTLIGVGATTLTSTSSFDGTQLIGDSNIVGLGLSTAIPGLSVGVGVDGHAPIDTNVSPLATQLLGLNIIENEQSTVTTIVKGIQTSTLTTDALDINFHNFLFGGSLLNGNIAVGQSSASFTRAVPEASTWAMMIIALGGLGVSMRSRNKAKLRVIFSSGFPALQAG